MSIWQAKYVIYENHVNKHITIHKNGCNQIAINGGTGEGKYIGFSCYNVADKYAETTKLPKQNCHFCMNRDAK